MELDDFDALAAAILGRLRDDAWRSPAQLDPDSRIAECHGFDLFLIEKIAAEQIRI